MNIDIEKYLSEEERKEIIIEVYKEEVLKNIKNLLPEKRIDDYERILGNSIYHYLATEVDSLIGVDSKKLISEKTEKAINSLDYKYHLLRKKSFWQTEDSPAEKIVKETTNRLRPQIEEKLTTRIFEQLDKIDLDDLADVIRESVIEILTKRLKGGEGC